MSPLQNAKPGNVRQVSLVKNALYQNQTRANRPLALQKKPGYLSSALLDRVSVLQRAFGITGEPVLQ